MFTDSTKPMDVESIDHDQCLHSELDPLIRHDLEKPTQKEARVARAQFIALCWALFVIGWTDGSAGPLLPSIQRFYNVSWLIPCFYQPSINSAGRVRNSVLGVCFGMHGQWY
jgi:hypothetical protein